MLDVLRRGSKSWFAKALLGLLVLSFGVWGIADYLVRGGGPEPAIIVGGQSFDADVVRERFTEDLARLRRQGLDLRPEQALAFGLLDRTVRTFVQGAVLDESGQRLHLTVTDETLRGLIASDKQFQDSQGRFDRERLNRLLTANGLTEKRYVELRRREMIREALIGPVLEGAAVPAVGADLLAAHISQRRSGTVVRVPLTAVADPPAEPADPAALEPVYQNALARFTVPETRTVSLLSLTTAAVIKDITVSDEAVQEAYDQRADQFAQPATRALTQGLFPSEEAARAALAEVRAGRSLEDATRAQTGKAAVALPAVTRDGLPAPLGDAVFAQPVGQVGEPVQGPFGWHLFLVSEETPAHTRALTEVKDELRAALAEEQAQDALYGLSTRLEDTLAGGASLEEAAAQVGGVVHTLTLRRDGSDAEGKPQEGLPRAKTFLTTVFGLQKGPSHPSDRGGARLFRRPPRHPDPRHPAPAGRGQDRRADPVAPARAPARRRNPGR
ncbi:peptidylprolyl isomerase [Pararhodospirillum photometricum]|nr:peptidylprolyl isomerase [Pararhodospirillum photometricum]